MSPPRTPPGRLWAHRAAPLAIMLTGLAAIVMAVGLSVGNLTEPGPGLWPFTAAAVVTITAAVLVFTDRAEDYEPWTMGSARVAAGVAGLGLFIVLFQVLGFPVAAFCALLFWLKVFGGEPWRWALPLAAGGAVVMHLLFVVALGVPFPPGVVG
ncbi:tripartite tricarboxylate transporter TctB family protein [Nonomuraea terrae]|uniref:tripartite tricarboxylate transporter TctB family protein n=1 Tax=Nonomuraea terrae TaxID=2530383 RepID=UPI0037A5347C